MKTLLRLLLAAPAIVLASASALANELVTLENVWQKNYLQASGSVTSLSETPSSGTTWVISDAGDGYVIFSDQAGNVLHAGKGPLLVEPVSAASPAAQWRLIDAGDGTVRLQNRARPQHYIHNQYGNPASGVIEEGWWSARWTIASPGPDQTSTGRTDTVTGHSVGMVAFEQGSYAQQGAGWVEKRADGSTAFTFDEIGRDDGSVYLRDTSRNVRLQLNLQTRQVLYAEGGGAFQPLYSITQVARPQAAVSGQDVRLVTFANGSYEQDGARWVEKRADGTTAFSFTETGRDDAAVELFDESRNVRLRLDLKNRQVWYAEADEPLRPLYNITDIAEAQLTIKNAATESVWVVEVAPTGEQNAVVQLAAGESIVQPASAGQVFAFAASDQSGWVGESYEVTAQATQQIQLPYRRPQSRPTAGPQSAATASSGRTPQASRLTDDQVEDIADILIKTVIQDQLDAQNRPAACWRDSYGRGVGKIPECSPDQTRDGLLCYEPCSKHPKAERGQRYENVGGVCWQQCPPGFRNDAAFCRKAEYGRGVGFPWEFGDGLTDSGMFARCEKKHGKGKCEKCLAIVYPKCKTGYKPVGCNICTPKERDCAAAGLGGKFLGSCAKKTFVTWPVKGGCANPATQENDAGLCYPKCRRGYAGVGPVCWATCPDSMPVNCGASCAKDKSSCSLTLTDQVLAPVMAAGNAALTVATLGTGTGAAAAAKGGAAGAKVAAASAARATAKAALVKGVKTALRAKVKRLAKELSKDLAIDAAVGGVLTSSIWAGMDAKAKAEAKKAISQQVRANLEERLSDEAAIDAVVEATLKGVEEQQPGSEFPWESLDPTGVAEIVVAYNIPLCSSL